MLELSLALVGLGLSAFFSGSELAFLTANPLQMEVWAKKRRRGAQRANELLSNPSKFMVSVLVGTTLSNVLATSFATIYLMRFGWHPLLVLSSITATILLFGEVLPKTIAGERPNQLLRLLAPLHRLWQLLFAPLASPLRKISDRGASNAQAASGSTSQSNLERNDLKLLFTRQGASQVLQKSEQELITQVFDLGETSVSHAMTPRTEVRAVPESSSMETVVHAFIDSGYSKLPVYRDSLDQVIGVVYLYDLFKDPPDLASIVHPMTMVPDSNTTMDVLKLLQRTHRPIAIVLDEYGGTAGLVTPEDLFEELFGEFEDEFDAQISAARRRPDGSVLADGRSKVRDLNAQFQLNIPEGDYETIAGYLTTVLDRIPHRGERTNLPFGRVTITRSSPSQIEQVAIHPLITKGSARGG